MKFGRDRHWPQAYLGQNSPFRMVDPGMTAFLVRANRDLLAMLDKYLPEDTASIERLQNHVKTLEQGWENLWNPTVNAYTAYDPVEQRHVDSVSAASFLASYAGIHHDAHHGPLMDQFDRIGKIAKFMVPSFDPEHADFDAKRYWRGPVWHVVNYCIGVGMSEIGDHDRAERIRSDSAKLVEQSGFYEYFNPLTGDGLGGKDFTWTASVYLDWVLQGKDNGTD